MSASRVGEEVEAAVAQVLAHERSACLLAERVFRLMNPSLPEFVPCAVEQFAGIELDFYRRTEKTLRAHGFDIVCDAEPRYHASPGGRRILMRFMISSDSRILATFYDVAARPRHGAWRRAAWWLADLLGRETGAPRGTLEFETEFANGEFVSTCTNLGRHPFSAPPEQHMLRMPPESGVASVLAEHRRRVASYLRALPQARLVPVSSLADIVESHRRQRLLKVRHRRAIGGVTRDELQRLAKNKFPYISETTMREMRRLMAEQDASATRAPVRTSSPA